MSPSYDAALERAWDEWDALTPEEEAEREDAERDEMDAQLSADDELDASPLEAP